MSLAWNYLIESLNVLFSELKAFYVNIPGYSSSIYYVLISAVIFYFGVEFIRKVR